MDQKSILNIFSNTNVYAYALIFVVVLTSFLYLDAQKRVTAISENTPAATQAVSPLFALVSGSDTDDEKNGDENTAEEVAEDETVTTPVEEVVTEPEVVFVENTQPVEVEAPVATEEEVSAPVENTEPAVVVEDETEEVVDTDENSEVQEDEYTPLALPYSESIFTESSSRWGSGYGAVSFTDAQLVIGGGDTDTAFLALLDGTTELTNYEYNVTLDWNRGKSVQLVSRFENYGNFATCSFATNGSGATIVTTTNGERETHGSSAGLPTKSFEGWKNLSFGMRVDGNTLYCLKDRNVVLKQELPSMPLSGGVGIALWSPLPGEALVHVKDVTIEALGN